MTPTKETIAALLGTVEPAKPPTLDEIFNPKKNLPQRTTYLKELLTKRHPSYGATRDLLQRISKAPPEWFFEIGYNFVVQEIEKIIVKAQAELHFQQKTMRFGLVYGGKNNSSKEQLTQIQKGFDFMEKELIQLREAVTHWLTELAKLQIQASSRVCTPTQKPTT